MTFDFRIKSEILLKEIHYKVPYILILYSKGDDDDNKEFVSSSFIDDNLVSKNMKTFLSIFFSFYFTHFS